MGDRLKDKVAIVTGSGRGIGRGIALLMAEEGAKVVVNDLGGGVDGTGGSATPADEVVKEIKDKGGTAIANYDSVATMEAGEKIIKTALDNFGRLDILVNNAGILRDRMVFNMAEEEWDAVIAVHLKGHFACTKPAAVLLRQQRSGCIINMTSTSGLLGNPGQANYGAAKSGIAGFTKVVARDLGRYGVRCNAIAPAAATRMTLSPEVLAAAQKRAERGITRESGEAAAGLSMLEQLNPDDVAPLAVYLASDRAAHINGQIFGASGGTYMVYSQPRPVRLIFKLGRWTLDELVEIVPNTIAAGLVNPAPPQPPKT